jgi:RNA polymerase sigma factor (sigma-70 family)
MRAAIADVEEIYRRRLPALCRVAAAVSGDRDAAPDIVQEAFIRAVRELGRFRGGGALEGWLWRIVVNTARSHRRDARPTVELVDDDRPSANGSSPNDAAHVAAAIVALPERQRLVLFLRYYADLDYGSIAEALEIRSGTVGATLNAARTTLQQLLSKEEVA